MRIARQLEAGDEFIELNRDNPTPQLMQLKEDAKYGFDVVVSGFEREEWVNNGLYRSKPLVQKRSQTTQSTSCGEEAPS